MREIDYVRSIPSFHCGCPHTTLGRPVRVWAEVRRDSKSKVAFSLHHFGMGCILGKFRLCSSSHRAHAAVVPRSAGHSARNSGAQRQVRSRFCSSVPCQGTDEFFLESAPNFLGCDRERSVISMGDRPNPLGDAHEYP